MARTECEAQAIVWAGSVENTEKSGQYCSIIDQENVTLLLGVLSPVEPRVQPAVTTTRIVSSCANCQSRLYLMLFSSRCNFSIPVGKFGYMAR